MPRETGGTPLLARSRFGVVQGDPSHLTKIKRCGLIQDGGTSRFQPGHVGAQGRGRARQAGQAATFVAIEGRCGRRGPFFGSQGCSPGRGLTAHWSTPNGPTAFDGPRRRQMRFVTRRSRVGDCQASSQERSKGWHSRSPSRLGRGADSSPVACGDRPAGDVLSIRRLKAAAFRPVPVTRMKREAGRKAKIGTRPAHHQSGFSVRLCPATQITGARR
jgi:hypothetical protein